MTMFAEQKAQQLDAMFTDLDANGETAAPDELDLSEETSGPEDEENETAKAELDAEDDDTGDLKALAKQGRRQISLEEARVIQARSRARGKKIGQVQAKKRAPATPIVRLPKNLVPPGDGFRTLVRRWEQKGTQFSIEQAGSYYYAAEIPCICEGTPERAVLRIPAGSYRFFDKAIDDETTYMGNPSRVTTDVTNFQRPSKNTYSGQDFLIQTLSMQEAGIRVRYEEMDISAANIPSGTISDMLRGKSWIWDDAGLFLPTEIYQDHSGENLLYRALRHAGALYFRWEKRGAGANGTSREVLIDHLRNIPDVRVRSLARTSGGAPVLPVSDGYIFTDDPERSEDGSFTAAITIHSDVFFPIHGVDIGAGKKAKPSQVGLYVQLNLNGISFQHNNRLIRQ